VEIGLCRLKLGQLEEGEKAMLQGISMNSRVHYGEPYLRLAEAFSGVSPEKALGYLGDFRQVHSSSCEAYYRQGQLYEQLGRKEDAKQAYQEAARIFRALPKYKRKSERKWAWKAQWKKRAL
jgi:tetratricopeptide (TPR) repeat protein